MTEEKQVDDRKGQVLLSALHWENDRGEKYTSIHANSDAAHKLSQKLRGLNFRTVYGGNLSWDWVPATDRILAIECIVVEGLPAIKHFAADPDAFTQFRLDDQQHTRL